jgi:hypothetical protein
MHRLLATVARVNPKASFVQIGADADPLGNPLHDVVLGSQWCGVIVEPIPPIADQLQCVYGEIARVSVERAAIASVDGERPFYYDPPAPGFVAAGALRREVLYFPQTYHPDLDERIVEIVTPCLTFESLCRLHGIESLDILRIDTAGDEADILGQVDFSRVRPSLIVYNHSLLGAGVRQGWRERLRTLGYQIAEAGNDTWCLTTRRLPAHHAAALHSIWSGRRLLRRATRRASGSNGSTPTFAFPVSEEERRYLLNRYDDRTPLPAEAASHLSEENPRLLELRRRYAREELPASQHYLWRPDTVAENVDLKYFRGDNLYVWHYPEHPRAMALKLFLYMRYLEEHGGRDLLGVLSEDGAFGCWTTEAVGYGKISRDLLDSVNEILFLDRHLEVLTNETLRILDIGAGYGRLGHRMTVAAPGLSDYCCVDAVPESTFLAEYYLGFRACSPPARVVPLWEVPNLEPGAFDLAVNVHSFSECTIDTIGWWAELLRQLRVPFLFVVPNEADGILSREVDGSYHSVLPVLDAAGYVPVVKERAIADRAARDVLMLNDNFYLFSLQK